MTPDQVAIRALVSPAAASRFQADFPGYDIRVTELAFHGHLVNDLLAMLHE